MIIFAASTDEMRILFAFLSLACVSLGWGSLWVNKYDLEEDVKLLNMGSNLLYLTVGDFEHNTAVATDLVASLGHQRFHCVDICDSLDVLPLLYEGSVDGNELLVVHGIEDMAANERRLLDFAYRLTDSTSDLSHKILLFVVDSETSGAPLDSQPQIAPPATDVAGLELKLVLAEALNEDSVFFNGHAFTGRLARTAFQSGLTDIKLSAKGCANSTERRQHNICTYIDEHLRPHISAHTAAVLDDSNKQVGFGESDLCPQNKAYKVVLTGVFLAMIYIAVYCWCKNIDNDTQCSRDSQRSTATQPGSQSVAAQVVYSGGAGSNLYTGASSSNYSPLSANSCSSPQQYTENVYNVENVHITLDSALKERTSRRNRRAPAKSYNSRTARAAQQVAQEEDVYIGPEGLREETKALVRSSRIRGMRPQSV